MPRASKPDRKQIYQTVVSRLCEKPEFAIEEIRESSGDEHRHVTGYIIRELVRQGSLQQVETDQGTRFRWKNNPEQFEVEPWVNGKRPAERMLWLCVPSGFFREVLRWRRTIRRSSGRFGLGSSGSLS